MSMNIIILAYYETCCLACWLKDIDIRTLQTLKNRRDTGVVYSLPHKNLQKTRNTLDCDQSNYSSRIVFSHITTEFGQTRISAIRSADPENRILEPNTE